MRAAESYTRRARSTTAWARSQQHVAIQRNVFEPSARVCRASSDPADSMTPRVRRSPHVGR
jgi:hypothetical protein